MSHRWQSGEFDRQRLHGSVRRFAPAHAAEHLTSIDLDGMWDRGKRLLLLDVDNTLVQWKTEEFAPEVVEWIERAKAKGFDICIISNTRREDRLARLSERLGVSTVRGRFKPSRAMFRLALIKFKRKPEEAIMVGDQMMTDVLGANRSGIDAIWVRKMEGKEFSGTRINRAIEGFLTSHIYEALVTPVDEAPGPEPKRSLMNQLVKFLIVGGTSFVVDYCVTMTLMFAIPWDGGRLSEAAGAWLRRDFPSTFGHFSHASDAFLPVASVIAACFSIANSWIWNRRWTFEIRGKQERATQLRRFLTVALSGKLIDLIVRTVLNAVLVGDPKADARIAIVVATFVAAFWNFAGQRLYAFRSKKP